MRFVVVGAGAIGGVLAALWHEAGVEVAVVARGAHLDAIRREGLRLVTPTRSTTVPVPASASLAEVGLGPGDVIVLAVKSQDTAAVLDDLELVVPAGLPIVCIQNGVDNERAALRRFPDVYGVCVMFPAAHLEPGVVHQLAEPVPGILDVGRVPDGVDPTAEAVAEALRAAGFAAEARPDIMAWKYRKLVMNLGNAADAVFGTDGRDADAARELRRAVTAEGEAVLSAAGIPVITRGEDRDRRGDLLDIAGMAARRAELGGVGGSTWQSLQRGQGSVETDYLTGEIVLLGRLHGVPTPANELFMELIREARRDGAAPGSVSAIEVARRLADRAGVAGAP